MFQGYVGKVLDYHDPGDDTRIRILGILERVLNFEVPNNAAQGTWSQRRPR